MNTEVANYLRNVWLPYFLHMMQCVPIADYFMNEFRKENNSLLLDVSKLKEYTTMPRSNRVLWGYTQTKSSSVMESQKLTLITVSERQWGKEGHELCSLTQLPLHATSIPLIYISIDKLSYLLRLEFLFGKVRKNI